MTKHLISLAAALALASPIAAQQEASRSSSEPAPSPNEIVAQAKADEWIAIAPEDLLVMTLAPDAEGSERKVIIQLMPAPFSSAWTANIRTFARDGWYDNVTVNRVQDNYVVQWGDATYDNPEASGEPKPLPGGLLETSEEEYVHIRRAAAEDSDEILLWHPKPDIRDSYADSATFDRGWPIGFEVSDGTKVITRWPVHCYGMVGVGRNYSPDAGTGAELYTVIGHAPRHLDRNIALVGRIVEGIEHLSSLPRGKGTLGFYEDESRRTAIESIRVASDLPEAEQPAFQYLETRSGTFARYAEARANRRDPFFNVPAGGADICNIPVPIRRVTE